MNRMMSRATVATGVVIALMAAPAAVRAQRDKVDVTGKWTFAVETAAGSGTPTMTFKQDGEKLTGHYSGQLGEAELTGTVKGQAISFAFSGDAQGTKVDAEYAGTIDGKDALKGKVTLVGLGEGTCTAKRQ
jgi:hypothetical protein